MLRKLKKNFLLKAVTFSFLIVAFGFNSSGYMPVFGVLMFGTAFLYGPSRIVLNFKAIPMELVLLNLWLGWAFFTGVLVSTNIGFFLQHFQATATLLLATNVLYLVLVYDPSIIKYVAIAFVVTGLVQYIAINFGLQNSEHVGKEREYGLEDNPNSLGLKMVYATFWFFFLFGRSIRKLPILLFVIGISYLFFQIILLSGSRKSVISFGIIVVALMAITMLNNQKKVNFTKLLLYMLFPLIVVSIVGSTLLEGSVVAERFENLEESGGVQENIRFTMYQFGLELFYDNPFFGVGLNNYKEHFFEGMYSHSDYIESLTSTGLFGFLLYQSAYVILLYKCFRLFFSGRIDKDTRFKIGFVLIGVMVLKIIGMGIILYLSPSAMLILATLLFIYYSSIHKVKSARVL